MSGSITHFFHHSKFQKRIIPPSPTTPKWQSFDEDSSSPQSPSSPLSIMTRSDSSLDHFKIFYTKAIESMLLKVINASKIKVTCKTHEEIISPINISDLEDLQVATGKADSLETIQTLCLDPLQSLFRFCRKAYKMTLQELSQYEESKEWVAKYFTKEGPIAYYQGTLYRGTYVPSTEVFTKGFCDFEFPADLESYISLVTRNVGVSTTKDKTIALSYVSPSPTAGTLWDPMTSPDSIGYVYEIDYGEGQYGIDITATRELRDKMFTGGKYEVNVAAPIPRQMIKQCWVVEIGHYTGKVIENKNYQHYPKADSMEKPKEKDRESTSLKARF